MCLSDILYNILYLWRVEPASTMSNKYTEVRSPCVAAFIGFAAQAKLVRFESDVASALHIPLISLNPSDVTVSRGIGICSAEVC